MSNFHNTWREFRDLNESSLTRLHQHMLEHDAAIITAYRNNPSEDPNNYCLPHGVPDSEQYEGSVNRINIARNRELHARLLGFNRLPATKGGEHKDYGVTKIIGTYVENYGDSEREVEVKEVSWFVTNLKDSPDFKQDIIDLGEEYCQDSIALIPKGGQGAYLVGTNHSDFPGYEVKMPLGDYRPGQEAEFMSRIRGRPFTLSEVKSMETFKDLSTNAKWVVAKITERLSKKRLAEGLSDYASAGKLRLFHYTRGPGGWWLYADRAPDSFELNPAHPKKMRHSATEFQKSPYHRSFFYLDPERKEPRVTGRLYTADISPESIYDLSLDPDDYLGKHGRDYTALLEDIHQNQNYDGVYYTIGGIPIVAYFEPIEVTKVEETD